MYLTQIFSSNNIFFDTKRCEEFSECIELKIKKEKKKENPML